MYVFRKKLVHLLNSDGHTGSFPIRHIYPGAPNRPHAAAYIQATNQTFIFKSKI